MKKVSKSSSLQAKWYKEDLWNMAMDKGDKEKANKILEATTIEEMDSIWYSNPKVDNFKKKKQNAKIKKAIGIILLILATLAIIGAIFFIYKACKSRHDAIEAEKNNPKHETLKKQINAENDTVNTLNDKLTAQKNSNEITFSENGKDYKAVFDKETNTYKLFEKDNSGKFSENPIKTITSENNTDFTNLQAKLQAQKDSNTLILENGNKAVFDADTKKWDIYEKTSDGFNTTPSQSITSGGDNNTLFSDLQQKLQTQQSSNEFIYTKDGKTYKAVFDEDSKTYNLFEQNDKGEFSTNPAQNISAEWNKDVFDDLQQKLQSQRTSNQITFQQDGKTLKAVFDKETNTFNVFEESQFSSKSGATLQLTSNNGKEIFFKENGKQMKYVYNEAKDCFDVFEAGKNGKFSKYPVKTIKHISVEEINKLKNVDFPKYMKIGAPMLGGGALLGIGGGCILASTNNEQQDIEEQEQASQLNLLSQTPYVGGYTYMPPYNQLTQKDINNEMATKYNTTGINQYNAGSIRKY